MDNFSFGFGHEYGDFSNRTELSSGSYIPAVRDCMSCGLCVGVCTTYKAKKEENYSPRGRIRLIDRVLNQDDKLKADELLALESCTLCRSCETICPSKMSYAELYNETVQKLDINNEPGIIVKLLLNSVSTKRAYQKIFHALIQIYQKSGLQVLFSKIPLSSTNAFKLLDKLLPPYQKASYSKENNLQTHSKRETIALFSACMSNIIDSHTQKATVFLLNSMGYEVHLVEKQTCCGAIHAHNGEMQKAKLLAKENISAFTDNNYESILFNSSGCGAFLQEYHSLFDDDEDLGRLPEFTDIMDFLSQIKWPEHIVFNESKIKVAVHEPCSQRNTLKNANLIYDLLNKIPGIELIPLKDNQICCGAGGTKMLTQAELAEPARDEKVAALLETKADLLVSTNMTCAMHISSGIRQAGKDIELIHPIELLARQIA